MSALSDLGTFLKGEREGVTLELDNKLNAIAPYSGYLAVSKKLDNFYFQTSSSFIASMADKNRYVKFLGKVVDTWSAVIQITSTQTANATATTLTMTNTTGLTVGKVIAILKGDLLVHTSVITAVSTNVSITILNSFNREATAYKVKIIQSINLNDYIPEVLVQDEATNGLTLQTSVNAGDYVVVDRIVQTGAELYRAKIDAPIGTSLTNTTYFEVRDSIGVTNQIGVFHKYNVLTNSYEGLGAEILFSDVSKEDLLDNPTWLAKNGFSKAGEYCYSKGTYLYLPVSVEQLGNKGMYYPFSNSMGTKKASDDLFWYNTAQTFTSLSDCFKTPKLLTTSGNIASGKSGRPDGKYFDVLYSDRSQDVREYAKVLNKWEVDLIWRDKEENGVEEVIFTEQVLQTTTGTVTTLEVGNGTNYRLGSVLQIWNGTTPYRRYIVSVSGNTVTLDSAIVKTAVPFIISGGKIPTLGSDKTSKVRLLGTPTNFPTVMINRLTESKYIIGLDLQMVDDLGNNQLFDGTKDSFKLGDKFTSILQSLRSTNSGNTYTSFTATNSTITNALTLTDEPTANIVLVSMTAKNKPYTQTTPKVVVEVLPKVKASNSHSIYKGALVGNQIAGKIQVGNGSKGYESKVLENAENYYDYVSSNTSAVCTQNQTIVKVIAGYLGTGGVAETYYKYIGTAGTINLTTTSYSTTTTWTNIGTLGCNPVHGTIALDNANSPASKWFECLEEGNNGVLAGVYGKELVWDFNKDDTTIELIAGVAFAGAAAGQPVYFKGFNNSVVNGRVFYRTNGIASGTYSAPTYDGWYLNEKDNQLYYQDDTPQGYFLWDGNGFGDNNIFDQLTNGTKTDLNGNTVRTFHGSLPINGRIK